MKKHSLLRLMGAAILAFGLSTPALADPPAPTRTYSAAGVSKWQHALRGHNPAAPEWQATMSTLRGYTQGRTDDMALLAVHLRMLDVIAEARIIYHEDPDYWMPASDYIRAANKVDSDDVAVATYTALKELGFTDVEVVVVRNSAWPTKPYFAVVRVTTDGGVRYVHMYTRVLLAELPPNMTPLYGLSGNTLRLYLRG
jgi:hypothetical protein